MWGGGCKIVHVCCLTCDATLMLRSCLGGVRWGGVCVCVMYMLFLRHQEEVDDVFQGTYLCLSIFVYIYIYAYITVRHIWLSDKNDYYIYIYLSLSLFRRGRQNSRWPTPVQLTQCGDLLNNKCQVPCPAR